MSQGSWVGGREPGVFDPKVVGWGLLCVGCVPVVFNQWVCGYFPNRNYYRKNLRFFFTLQIFLKNIFAKKLRKNLQTFLRPQILPILQCLLQCIYFRIYSRKKFAENQEVMWVSGSELGKPSFKKNLFCEKVSQTGGGGHLDFIPLFFYCKCPKI